MVCYTEPSGKSSLESIWKKADAFEKDLACDCKNQPWDSGFISSKPVHKIDLLSKLVREDQEQIFRMAKPQCLPFLLFQWRNALQLRYYWCRSQNVIVNFLAKHQMSINLPSIIDKLSTPVWAIFPKDYKAQLLHCFKGGSETLKTKKWLIHMEQN